jgi:hypothetical protein
MKRLFARLHDWLLGRRRPPSEDDYLADLGNWTDVTSSNVKSVAYYFDVSRPGGGGVLAVRFLKTDRLYCYDDIPLTFYVAFLASDSKGKFVWEYLRDTRYPFRNKGDFHGK